VSVLVWYRKGVIVVRTVETRAGKASIAVFEAIVAEQNQEIIHMMSVTRAKCWYSFLK
jgi:hypothetical protein